MNNKILIISGDPNSINSEIIYKSWFKLEKSIKRRICIISNYDLLNKQFKKLNYSIKFNVLRNINDKFEENKLNIININLKFKKPFSVRKKESSKFVLQSLDLAHKFALSHKVSGIINCAIDKRLLNKENVGVTEYLAKKCKVRKNSEVMLIRNDKLSVVPITTHIDVKKISKKINQTLILKKIYTINSWFKKHYKIKPKIGILGLNPHNAELKQKSEERKIIIPAITKLKKKRVNIKGPLVSDTVFISEYKNYDVIVGMYHDQVLSPFKTLYKYDGVNVTLGLKYLRVSPDHGTAKELIGKKVAKDTSLTRCIKFVNKFKK